MTTQKNSAAADVGAWGTWVEFWIGQPQVELSIIDFSVLKQVQFSSLDYQKIEAAWQKKAAKPMISSGAGKVESGEKTAKREALRQEPVAVHPPDPGKLLVGPGAMTLPDNSGVENKPLPKRRTLPSTIQTGPKLTVKDVNPTNTLKLIAGKSVDLAFSLGNGGDEASDRTPYSLSCKVLGGGGRCPFNDLRGVLSPIAANAGDEINVKGLRFPPGDFELTLKLANVTGNTLTLGVAAATVTPGAARSAPKMPLNRDNEPIRRHQAPLRRVQ